MTGKHYCDYADNIFSLFLVENEKNIRSGRTEGTLSSRWLCSHLCLSFSLSLSLCNPLCLFVCKLCLLLFLRLPPYSYSILMAAVDGLSTWCVFFFFSRQIWSSNCGRGESRLLRSARWCRRHRLCFLPLLEEEAEKPFIWERLLLLLLLLLLLSTKQNDVEVVSVVTRSGRSWRRRTRDLDIKKKASASTAAAAASEDKVCDGGGDGSCVFICPHRCTTNVIKGCDMRGCQRGKRERERECRLCW